ncbi:MAG: flagellin [bacterium]|nr:flagellin [bacterium]
MISMINNLWANNAHRLMNKHSDLLGTAMERIASTKKLNSAADNPAGIGIYQRMQARLGGITSAIGNAQGGVSILQTANTALDSIYNLLNDALQLSIDSQDATLQPAQRAALDTDFQSKMSSINDLANTTRYNSISLLNVAAPPDIFDLGAAAQAGSVTLSIDGVAQNEDPANGFSISGDQITLNGTGVPGYWDEVQFGFTASAATPTIELGAQPNAARNLDVRINGALVSQSSTDGWQLSNSTLTFNGTAVPQAGDDVSLSYRVGGSHFPISLQLGAQGYSSERMELPVAADVRSSALNLDTSDITTVANAESAETAVENAIDTIINMQATLGQYEDSLTNRITNLQKEAENVTDSASRLSDADMAQEITNQALYEAMTQASASAIYTANSLHGNLLQILGIIPG